MQCQKGISVVKNQAMVESFFLLRIKNNSFVLSFEFLPLSFEFYLIFLRDVVTVVTVYRPAGDQSPKAVHLGQRLVKSCL